MKYPYLYSTLIGFVTLSPLQSPSCLAATSNDDGAILVLGDSWASLSNLFLSNVCHLGTDTNGEERAITNNGKSGSTAKQWASGDLAVQSFTDAKYDYDHVWLSIGGNDFNCDPSYHEEIAGYILEVISDIFASSSNDNMEVLYTGYGYPSEDICKSGDSATTIALLDHLASLIRTKIEKSSYSEKVKVMDIASMFVTEDSSPFSDKEWYADDIHINEAGYEKLFSTRAAQEFFGCANPYSFSPSLFVNDSSFSPSLSPSLSVYKEDPSIFPSPWEDQLGNSSSSLGDGQEEPYSSFPYDDDESSLASHSYINSNVPLYLSIISFAVSTLHSCLL